MWLSSDTQNVFVTRCSLLAVFSCSEVMIELSKKTFNTFASNSYDGQKKYF